MFQFQKATKNKIKARVAITGPSGSGKTYTALIAATALSAGGKIAVIDTERGSASLYSDKFDFDVLELDEFSPATYTKAIEAAQDAGYDVIVIDSLSHAWEGEGGAIDMVDDAAARSRTGNSYTAWREVTPIHRRMVDAILQSKSHVIATMRSKTEYVLETDSKGRQVPRKVGMAPIQRSGMEYEFTVVCDMDLDHKIVVSKSRFEPLQDAVETKPTEKFFRPFVEWLEKGDAKPETPAAPKPVTPKPTFQKPASDQQSDQSYAGGMTIEEAYGVKTSEGKLYGEMTEAGLERMLSHMWKQLKQNHLEPDERVEIERKIKAAQVVLAAKRTGEIN